MKTLVLALGIVVALWLALVAVLLLAGRRHTPIAHNPSQTLDICENDEPALRVSLSTHS